MSGENGTVTEDEARTRSRAILADACADLVADLDLAHAGFFEEIERQGILRSGEVEAFRTARASLDAAMKSLVTLTNLLKQAR